MLCAQRCVYSVTQSKDSGGQAHYDNPCTGDGEELVGTEAMASDRDCARGHGFAK